MRMYKFTFTMFNGQKLSIQREFPTINDAKHFALHRLKSDKVESMKLFLDTVMLDYCGKMCLDL